MPKQKKQLHEHQNRYRFQAPSSHRNDDTDEAKALTRAEYQRAVDEALRLGKKIPAPPKVDSTKPKRQNGDCDVEMPLPRVYDAVSDITAGPKVTAAKPQKTFPLPMAVFDLQQTGRDSTDPLLLYASRKEWPLPDTSNKKYGIRNHRRTNFDSIHYIYAEVSGVSYLKLELAKNCAPEIRVYPNLHNFNGLILEDIFDPDRRQRFLEFLIRNERPAKVQPRKDDFRDSYFNRI